MSANLPSSRTIFDVIYIDIINCLIKHHKAEALKKIDTAINPLLQP